MIAIDTNVLIRFLVQDDAAQGILASRLLEDAARRGEQVVLSNIVLCEMVWVLDAVYGASKRKIIETLRRLFGAAPFGFEAHETVGRAIERYARGRGDFSDFLIGESGAAVGSRTTYSFEKALRDEPDFTLLTQSSVLDT